MVQLPGSCRGADPLYLRITPPDCLQHERRSWAVNSSVNQADTPAHVVLHHVQATVTGRLDALLEKGLRLKANNGPLKLNKRG